MAFDPSSTAAAIQQRAVANVGHLGLAAQAVGTRNLRSRDGDAAERPILDDPALAELRAEENAAHIGAGGQLDAKRQKGLRDGIQHEDDSYRPHQGPDPEMGDVMSFAALARQMRGARSQSIKPAVLTSSDAGQTEGSSGPSRWSEPRPSNAYRADATGSPQAAAADAGQGVNSFWGGPPQGQSSATTWMLLLMMMSGGGMSMLPMLMMMGCFGGNAMGGVGGQMFGGPMFGGPMFGGPTMGGPMFGGPTMGGPVPGPTTGGAAPGPQPNGGGGYGPKIDAVPNFGAAGRYVDYADLRRFSQDRASMDGSFVTAQSTPIEDQYNARRLQRAIDDGYSTVQTLTSKASPQERALLDGEEQKLQAQLSEQQSRGLPPDPGEVSMARASYTHALWKKGQINDELGQRNAELLEMLDMGHRAQTNMMLKNGMQLSPNWSRKWFDESPFNPQRQARPAEAAFVPRGGPAAASAATSQAGAAATAEPIQALVENMNDFKAFKEEGREIPQRTHADARDRLNGLIGYWMQDHSQDPALDDGGRKFAAQMKTSVTGYIDRANDMLNAHVAEQLNIDPGAVTREQRMQFNHRMPGFIAQQMMEDANSVGGPRYSGLWVAGYQYLNSKDRA